MDINHGQDRIPSEETGFPMTTPNDRIPCKEGEVPTCEYCGRAIEMDRTGDWLHSEETNPHLQYYCYSSDANQSFPVRPSPLPAEDVEMPSIEYKQDDWDYADAAAAQAKEQRSVNRPSPATALERMAVQLRGAWASVSARERQLRTFVARASELRRERDEAKEKIKELKIRLKYNQFDHSAPEKYWGCRTAYRSGHETGWRGETFDQPYTSVHHQDAYEAGYRTAQIAVAMRLAKLKEAGDV